ncbi:uncharacterized protein TM35_000222360 [Trypanosoma theileri]|uniref:Uncharacterized protein n=1 Tax=Trypanosoma theileri TaxID=67003 RepID=A0A1X0NRX3_9TRYP|nr:uncharacterized protein TM35_000222360 [Trypanosoma theileri]ORC87437.1 hypothetical protein TM35_000222360 [Trypanosoma theileri]
MKEGYLWLHVVALLWSIALATLFCPIVLAADPPAPAWKADGCSAGFSYCSNVTTKESWSSGDKLIYFSVDAVADSSDFYANNVTMWYVGENFQINWANSLFQKKFNVVRFSPRGSEFAYPQITCNANYYDKAHYCWPNASCAEEIARSGLRMEHYSITETANDLAWVLKTLGKGNQNVVVTEGIGSFVVHRMLKLYNNLDNVSVIMAGFGHPEYFDIFESIMGYDETLQRLLQYCEEDEGLRCVARVGAAEGMWNRFVNVMTAAEMNTLKCNSLLQWGVPPAEMHREYRAITAALLKNPQHFLMDNRRVVAQLIPSFIYRLQRCNAQDLVALQQLYTFVKSGPASQCPVFVPQRYNWLVNELTLTPPAVPPQELLQEARKVRQLLPNITVLQPLYDLYNAFPKYNVTDRKIARPVTKMLFILSDTDPVFPYGASALAATAYQGIYRSLPHQSGLPVGTSAAHCIEVNLDYFRQHLNWSDATACTLTSSYKIDFIGMDAREFYGTVDAWEFTIPNPPENVTDNTPTTTTVAPSGPCNEKSTSSGATTVLAVFLTMSLIALLGVGYLYWKSTRVRFSDDFYTNLSH